MKNKSMIIIFFYYSCRFIVSKINKRRLISKLNSELDNKIIEVHEVNTTENTSANLESL